MERMRYCAFISYRHQTPDQEIAKALHTAIENYGIPRSVRKQSGRKKTGKVFRDQEELPLSSNLGADIEMALDRSEWFIAICSPRYLESRWCLREMEYFIQHKGRERILTVLVEGEPEDSFPEMIRYAIDESGERIAVEPLAADVRSGSLAGSLKRLKNEKLRIIAPMLGLAFDELKRRARQRKLRIISAVSAAVLVSAAGAAAFLIANHAHQEKLRQQVIEEQRKAEEERIRAEEERLNAVTNNIGEWLQRAAALRENEDRRQSAALLLEALDMSVDNGDLRREEILSQLQKTMYIEPFTVISKLDLQNARLVNAQVSPDGTKAVCSINGNEAALIDLNTGHVVYTVSKSNAEMDDIRFSPDGSRFLTIYDYYHYMTVWNTEDGSEVFTYASRADRRGTVANARFLGGADKILIQDNDNFYVISLPGGEEKRIYTIGEQQEGYDSGWNLYTIGQGAPISQIITDIADNYANMPIAVSRDGSRILVSGISGITGTIVINSQGERVSLLEQLPGTLAERYDISPDGSLASCQSFIGFAGVWDTEKGRMRFIKSMNRGFSVAITAPVFSPDSQKAAYLSNGTLTICEAWNGKELATAELEWDDAYQFQPGLHWTEDGKYLLVDNIHLYIVDAETGRIVLSRLSDLNNPYNNALPAGSDQVFVTRGGGEAVCYSLPGIASIQISGDDPGDIYGYDPTASPENPWKDAPVKEHEVTDTFKALSGLTDFDPQLYYSREGAYAALLFPDGVIEIFSKDNIEKPLLVNSHFKSAPTAFGIIGNTLAAADSLGRVMFQDLTDGKLTILDTGAAHLTFVFGGDLLMASQLDGTVIDVYDTQKAEFLFSMRNSVPFRTMGFSADGRYAVAHTDNQWMTAELWLDESALLEQARRLVRENR